jgi:hypothetical protein
MSQPTASTFRDPLLRVLGTRTQLVAGTHVAMDDAIADVLTNTGYTEEQFGKDNHGYFKVRLWIQQAFNKILRKQNIAEKVQRGTWTLTDEGVKAAALLLGTSVPPVAPESDDLDDLIDGLVASDPTPEAPVAAPVEPVAASDAPAVVVPPAAHDGGGGVSWTVGERINTYNPDPYIRGIAIASTACFGQHSNRSEPCKTCPLSGACKGAMLSRLSEIAAQLERRDAQAARGTVPDPVGDGDDIDDILEAIEKEVTEPEVDGPEGVRIMTVPAPGKCKECGERIDKGQTVPWIRNVGMYHQACFDKAHPKK